MDRVYNLYLSVEPRLAFTLAPIGSKEGNLACSFPQKADSLARLHEQSRQRSRVERDSQWEERGWGGENRKVVELLGHPTGGTLASVQYLRPVEGGSG